MTLVSELELPSFDHTDAQMRGARFHEEMASVRAQGPRRPVRHRPSR